MNTLVISKSNKPLLKHRFDFCPFQVSFYMSVFIQCFINKVFNVTLKGMTIKYSIGNIIHNQLTYTLRSNSKLKIYLKQL